MIDSLRANERGQSETLGFVFVFALITLSIGVVFTTGIAGLDDAREAEQVNNVERAFDVLADNIDDLDRHGVPSRATEVRVGGGVLRIGEPVTFTLNATDSSDPDRNVTLSTDVRPIVYEADDGTEIVYVNGALIRNEGNAIVLTEPDWMVTDEHAVVPMIATYGSRSAVGDGATVLVVTELRSQSVARQLTTDDSGTAEVNITVESSRADAWESYFQQEGFEHVRGTPGDGNITYQFETDAIYAPQTSIEVDLSG